MSEQEEVRRSKSRPDLQSATVETISPARFSDTNSLLLMLLLIVIAVSVTVPQWKSYPTVTEVREETGIVCKGSYDEQGKYHGLWRFSDKDGRLFQEIEYDHGMRIGQRNYAPDGTVAKEFREDGNYQLIQISPGK